MERYNASSKQATSKQATLKMDKESLKQATPMSYEEAKVSISLMFAFMKKND